MRKISNRKNWYGEIPNDWKVDRIGSVFKLRNTKVSDYDYRPLSVTMNGIVPQLESAAKTNAHDDRKLVKAGDFAINSRSDRRGACGISNYDGSVSLINTVVTPMENINSKYYDYLFHSASFADEFYKWGHGIVDDLWTTGWGEMKNIRIPIPPIKIQEKIAKFLSLKCGVIDEIVEKINIEIEELKKYKQSLITEVVTKGLDKKVEMKKSGVDWIGKIPKGWEVKRLKYTCEQRSEKNNLEKELDYFALENIESWNFRYIETENEYDITESNICNKNDVVFGKLRPYLAKTFLVDYDRCCSSEFVIFYNFLGLQKFLLYVLTSYGFVTIVDSSTYGTKMPRANVGFIKNMRIPLPKLNEQEKIVNYLDKKCEKIDNILDKKSKQIETLERYKKSLIYEYVTGKKSA